MSVAMSLSVGRSRYDFLQYETLTQPSILRELEEAAATKTGFSQPAFIVPASGIEGRGP